MIVKELRAESGEHVSTATGEMLFDPKLDFHPGIFGPGTPRGYQNRKARRALRAAQARAAWKSYRRNWGR